MKPSFSYPSSKLLPSIGWSLWCVLELNTPYPTLADMLMLSDDSIALTDCVMAACLNGASHINATEKFYVILIIINNDNGILTIRANKMISRGL